VVAGNGKSYQKWIDEWGIRLKNVALFHIKNEADLKGWESEGKVFYTILPGYSSLKNHAEIMEQLRASEYRCVSRNKIETKLKKVSIHQEHSS
jgi:hypothetical protein